MSPADASTFVADDTPLCVDLDGTLLRGDSMVEALLLLLRRQPWCVFLFPLWLIGGRAAFKAELGRRCAVDAGAMQFDGELVEWLQGQRRRGRRLVLCTGADQVFASAAAEHLQLFERAIGSDGRQNLTGTGKMRRLQADYGPHGFDYAGNSSVDLKVWAQARRAIVVGGEDLARRAATLAPLERLFERRTGGLREWLRAMRVHQWAKNALLFVPLLAAHAWTDLAAVAHTVAACVAFCMCASGAYLVNDLLDLAADRAHPRKRNRPFASGALHPGAGVAAALGLLVAGYCLAAYTSILVLGLLALYVKLSLTYSSWIKRQMVGDVMTLAGLYTLRVVAGAAAAGVEASFWLLGFSMALFLSLALVKRCAELRCAPPAAHTLIRGRGYVAEDLPILQQLGAAAGYLSVLVLALYVDSPASQQLYHRPHLLWGLCPLLLLWISRVWIITHRGDMHDDPVVFALRDGSSRLIGALALLIVAAAV